jgi:hypothetical protein
MDADFLTNLYKTRHVWKQTSYNGQLLEKTSLVLDILMMKIEMLSFLPKPFNSWILNEDYLSMGSTSCISLMMVKIIIGTKKSNLGSNIIIFNVRSHKTSKKTKI